MNIFEANFGSTCLSFISFHQPEFNISCQSVDESIMDNKEYNENVLCSSKITAEKEGKNSFPVITYRLFWEISQFYLIT